MSYRLDDLSQHGFNCRKQQEEKELEVQLMSKNGKGGKLSHLPVELYLAVLEN